MAAVEITSELLKLYRDNSSLNEQIKTLERELAMARSGGSGAELHRLQETVASQVAQLAERDARIHRLDANVQERDTAIKHLRLRLGDRESRHTGSEHSFRVLGGPVRTSSPFRAGSQDDSKQLALSTMLLTPLLSEDGSLTFGDEMESRDLQRHIVTQSIKITAYEKDISSLHAQLGALQEENSGLQNRIKTLEEEGALPQTDEDLRSELVVARSKISEFADMLGNAQERARETEGRVTELDDLRNKLVEQRHQIETLQGQLAIKDDQEAVQLAQAELQSLREQIVAADGRVAEVEASRASLAQQLEEQQVTTKQALATATAQLEAGTARLTNMDELNQRLKQATAEVATQAAQLRDAETRLAQIDGLNQQVRELVTEIASTTAALQEAKSKVVQLEESNQQLQEANDKGSVSAAATETALREQASKIEADFTVRQEAIKAELARVEHEKRLAVQQASVALKSNREAEQAKVETVEREAAAREEELNKLMDTRAKEYQKTEAQLRKKFDATKTQLEGANRTMREQVNVAEKQRKAAEAAQHELASRADMLQKQLDAARTSTAGASQTESLQAELAALRAKVTDEGRKAAAAITARDQVDTELKRYLTKVAELEGSASTLQEAVRSVEADKAKLELLVEEKQALIEGQKSTTADQAEQMKQLLRTLEGLQTKLATLTNERDEALKERDRLQSIVQDRSPQSTQEVQVSREVQERTKKEFHDTQMQLSHARNRVDDLEKEVKRLTAKLTEQVTPVTQKEVIEIGGSKRSDSLAASTSSSRSDLRQVEPRNIVTDDSIATVYAALAAENDPKSACEFLMNCLFVKQSGASVPQDFLWRAYKTASRGVPNASATKAAGWLKRCEEVFQVVATSQPRAGGTEYVVAGITHRTTTRKLPSAPAQQTPQVTLAIDPTPIQPTEAPIKVELEVQDPFSDARRKLFHHRAKPWDAKSHLDFKLWLRHEVLGLTDEECFRPIATTMAEACKRHAFAKQCIQKVRTLGWETATDTDNFCVPMSSSHYRNALFDVNSILEVINHTPKLFEADTQTFEVGVEKVPMVARWVENPDDPILVAQFEHLSRGEFDEYKRNPDAPLPSKSDKRKQKNKRTRESEPGDDGGVAKKPRSSGPLESSQMSSSGDPLSQS